MDDGHYWPVVAEFFISVLAIFVLLYAAADRPDPILVSHVERLRADLESERLVGNVQHSDVTTREVRIVYSDKALGFAPCKWDLAPEAAARLRTDLRRLEPLLDYATRLHIEGHADLRPATNCQGLRFKSNFELSENRAMSVFAALLGRSIEELDDVVRAIASDPAAERTFIEQMTGSSKVLVAGFGATRPFEIAADVYDARHRRVEIRVTLERPK